MKKYLATLTMFALLVSLLALTIARGAPQVSEISVDTGNGFGSSGTFALRFATIDMSTGSSITYSQSAVNGDSFTINVNGVYAMSYTDGTPSGDAFAISVNSSAGSSLNSASPANLLCRASMAANEGESCSVTTSLTSGDVIRAHRAIATDGGTNAAARFIIVRIL